jgi:hypothetical protein
MTRLNHLDIVEVFFLHSFKVWDPCRYASQIMLDSFVGIPVHVLALSVGNCRSEKMESYVGRRDLDAPDIFFYDFWVFTH